MQTPLTSTISGKANLSGAAFTGTIAAPTINLNGASIATSLDACAKKTNGSIAGTTAFQTIYTVALGTRGFITVISGSPNYSRFMGFFEWTAAGTYQSLTQLAQSGNNTQGVLNTTNMSTGGVMNLTVQQVSNVGTIQATVATNSNINWYVMLLSLIHI